MQARGILVGLVAGMSAVTYHVSTQTTETKSTELTHIDAGSKRSESLVSELAKTLQRFDKTRSFRISVQSDGIARLAEPAPQPMGMRFDWVIAIVPDPIHSNLRLDFDRELEFVQLGATKAKYQFERYWLPWKPGPSPQVTDDYLISRVEQPSGPGIFRITTASDDTEHLPGVMLFRNDGPPTPEHDNLPPLAVFLVSESPTGGISPEEFRSAVSLGKALSALDGKSHSGPLRIIGPGMSGSLATLGTLINSDDPKQEIFVRTWTIDHWSHIGFRRLVEDANRDQSEEDPCNARQEFHFKPVEIDSWPEIYGFANFVRKTWKDNSPIVLLTEEDTAFGALTELTRGDSKPCVSSNGFGDPDGVTDARAPGKFGYSFYRIPFPRNLSKLRNASESQDRVPGFPETSHKSEVPHNGITMSLREEENGDTLEIPTFSKEQTPVSQESVVFTIGNLLKGSTVHYVGIFATDPLDTLFLLRYLRRTCPNARIFTMSSDLLLEHGSDSADYSGILSVSNFPLFPLSQVWNRNTVREHSSDGPTAEDPVYAFPSDTSEAVYNATLEVLRSLPACALNGKKLADLDRRDIADPFSEDPRRSLWLTVAGRSGFEPIALIDDGPLPPLEASAPRDALFRNIGPDGRMRLPRSG